ncbi:Threonine/homoserine/homoserine lactone efflux protein [Actinopolyspora mzabensis]|uniref:Threonine/homoserine/homoserine lactone efflux protein n=1 Tax=Actinopolyspora mzabensis TaxID=995066 RepID=A0A1G9AIR3_ACTMZ|nr:LysE family translocator [Actinopolyspora mzabensis]SDK27266.1 Threonine/homoserine/homoserine lactone efflux protein [Actinopolyspora mzabensis]
MIEHVVVFIGTTVLMLAVPGPDFVLVTRNAVAGDRKRGYRTMAGICAGLASLTVITASGLAAVIAASTTMLTILRTAGGIYLLALGGFVLLSLWRRRQRTPTTVPPPRRANSPFLQGFLNNVLNPKALLFYLTFMPQFLLASGPPVFVQTLFMGMLVVGCAATWWTLYVTALGSIHPTLARGSVRTAVDAGAGTALGALGAVALVGGL